MSDYRDEALNAIVGIERLRIMASSANEADATRYADVAIKGMKRLVDDRNKAVAALLNFEDGSGAGNVETALIALGCSVLDTSKS